METLIPSLESLEKVLICPDCGGDLSVVGDIRCLSCGTIATQHLGIPVLQPKSGQVVRQFSGMRNPLQREDAISEPMVTKLVNTSYLLFAKTPFWPHAAATYRSNKALKRLLSGVRGVALEVGCGEHSAAPFVSREDVVYIPTDYIGWDEVVDMDRHWNGGLLTHRRTRGPLFWADSVKLPMRSASLDAWIAIETLEHLPFPERALTEASRCLKVGGRAYISVPWLLRVHGGHDDEGDYGRYTRRKLELMAHQSGMELIDFFVNTSVWTTLEFLVSGYIIRIILEHVANQFVRVLCGLLATPIFLSLNLLAFTCDRRGDRRFALRYFAILEKR